MNGPPRIPWTFYLAVVVFIVCCGVASYMLGWAYIINSVNHTHP